MQQLIPENFWSSHTESCRLSWHRDSSSLKRLKLV
jgi:hypothetical protein